MTERFHNQAVAEKFDQYDGPVRGALLRIRELVFETAGHEPGIGHVEETLKWGQISYLTVETKAGTTLRMDEDHSHGGQIALYVNCKSTLVPEWRDLYPELSFGGDRSVHFDLHKPLPEQTIRHLIAMTLTYHQRKRNRPAETVLQRAV